VPVTKHLVSAIGISVWLGHGYTKHDCSVAQYIPMVPNHETTHTHIHTHYLFNVYFTVSQIFVQKHDSLLLGIDELD